MAEVTNPVVAKLVPAGVLGNTRSTRLKLAEAPESIVAIVAVIVEVPPDWGLAITNAGPAIWEPEIKTVLAGKSIVPTTAWASLGPAFASVIV